MVGGNWRKWWDRRDLLDNLIAKGADVTVRVIQNVDRHMGRCVLAALFDKGETGMIDGVLERVEHGDSDLVHFGRLST